jgi:hypothetical protein
LRSSRCFLVLTFAVIGMACNPKPRDPVAADFRESLIRHGATLGELTDTVPPHLAVIEPGKRISSKCASGTLQGHAIDLCLWKYPSSMEAIQYSDIGPKPWPPGTHRHVHGDMWVVVAPTRGLMPAEVYDIVKRSVFALSCVRGGGCTSSER